MQEVTPQDPPPMPVRNKSRDRWLDVAQKVRGLDGAWAFIGNHSPGVATHIRRGRYRAFLSDLDMDPEQAEQYMTRNWELTTRKSDQEKRVGVWVRYIGNDQR
jgi:hypothetical protein